MDRQVARWCVDLAMGSAFLVCLITGLFKFTLLMRTLGLMEVVLPIALFSVIHDWSGLALGILVAVHLYLNRAWIMTMTKKVLGRANRP
jgi:cytochrome b subunit of formate dehydrogenase